MFSSRSICSREIMLAAPRLRGIVNPTIGLETVDLAAANELGVIVGHGATPGKLPLHGRATVIADIHAHVSAQGGTKTCCADRRSRQTTGKGRWRACCVAARSAS